MRFNKAQREGLAKMADNIATACTAGAIAAGLIDRKIDALTFVLLGILGSCWCGLDWSCDKEVTGVQVEALIMLIVITVFLGGLAYFGTRGNARKSAGAAKQPEGKSKPKSSLSA